MVRLRKGLNWYLRRLEHRLADDERSEMSTWSVIPHCRDDKR